ncbi:hypothetical protein GmRootV116_44830 [Variovorax sp. V116]
MLEGHIGIGAGQQCDQVGLDEQVARQQVAQQLIAVVGHRPDAIDQDTMSCTHMAKVSAPRLVPEEPRRRHPKTIREALQRLHRRRDQPALDA